MEKDGFKRTRRLILNRVLLVPFILLILVCSTLVYYFATTLRDRVARNLVRIADGHRRLIEQFLQERAFNLRFAAASHSFEELTHEYLLAGVLEQLQTGSPAFFDIGVFDQAGNHVAYVGPYKLKGINYAQTEWFRAVQKEHIYISDVFQGYRHIPHFIIAVRQEKGNSIWYLRATIDTLFFNELVENIRIGKTGEAYLINKDGVFQTRRRSGGALMDVDPDHAVYKSDEKSVVSFTADDQEGGRYLYATGRLSSTGWLLIVRQEIGDAYAPLTHAVVVAISIIILGGGVVLFMTFVLATGLANRLTVADMEKRQMRGQLIMAGKLAEVGEMSAGVAHEINNPLQVMKSEHFMINDLLNELEKDNNLVNAETLKSIRDSVQQIGLQIDRCKQITHGLLGFSRKSETSFEAIDLRSLIPNVVDMIEHRAQLENIRIMQQFEPDLPTLSSDPAQLQQVFLNLLNNAMYACKSKHGGEIRITAGREGDFITVSVADDGCGITPEHMEKIFLPFFTTKPVGQGTGLGLSTCYGIVERLGGQITVSSEFNVGSVFTVRLPIDGPPNRAKVG